VLRLAFSAFALALTLVACGPSDPLAEIEKQQAQGAWADTIEPLRELLEERPRDAEVLYRYGLALTATGQHNLAHWSLRLAMEDPEWLVPAGLEMAQGMLYTTNFQESIDAATAVLEADPDNLRALLLRGVAYTESNLDQEAAIADARRVFELDPDNMDAFKPLVLGLLSLDRGEEAGEVISDLGRRLDEADADDTTTAWHCATTALFADESGEQELAAERWERCLEKYPGVSNVVVNAADFYSEQGDVERRTEVLRAALAAEPESREFRLMLAGQLRFLGENDEADALLLAATEGLAPGMGAQAWTDLAKHRQDVGDFAGAVEAMDRAVETVSQVSKPWAQLLFDQADALILAGEYERALAVANQTEVAAHAAMIRARVAQERGEYREALGYYDEAFRLWPDNTWGFYYAALAAEAIGDFERAMESYRSSIRLDPAATDARTRAARYLLARGRPAAAFGMLRFKVDVAPLEDEGEILGIYLWARAGQAGPLGAALTAVSQQRPAILGRAVAAAARGARDRSGAAAAVGVLGDWQDQGVLDLTDPSQADALRALVRYAHEAGSLAEAEATAARAVRSHPDSARLHAIAGYAASLREAPAAEVRAAYERALALDPEDPWAHAGLGELALADDPQTALEHFERAAAAAPAEAAYPRQAAQALVALGRGEEAEARLEASLIQHPTDAEAAETLARLRSARGESSERTLELANRAVLMGRGPDALDLVSHIYEQRNDPERAQRAAEQAQEMRSRLGSDPEAAGPRPS
jgi:tetratricopeptide (TPR) repeat protein